MTIVVYDGPGVETYRSSRFSATIAHPQDGDLPAYVYGVEDTTTLSPIAHWFALNDSMEMSWVTVSSDEDVTFNVTRLAGAITSATVFPTQKDYTYSYTGSVLTITVPSGEKAWIELNGDRHNIVLLFNDELYDAAVSPVAWVDAATTPSTTGQTLYFGPGVHTVGHLFPLADDSVTYLDGGAWVIGSFDVREVNGVTITGPGVLSGEYVAWATVRAIVDYYDKLPYSAVYGFYTGHVNVGNTITGITSVSNSFFFNAAGVNSFQFVKVIAPWHQNCDGFEPYPDNIAAKPSLVEDCFAYCGDNTLKAASSAGNLVVRRNLFANTSSETLHCAYWPYHDYGFVTTMTDNYIVANQMYYLLGDEEICSVVYINVDGTEQQSALGWGRYHVNISQLYIDRAEVVPIFNIQNHIYGWGLSYDVAGNIAYCTFTDIFCPNTPATLSRLNGRDLDNTPHDIAFSGIYIGGTEVTVRNVSDFFDINEFPYNISFGGRTMTSAVDICNIALSNIGAAARVTSIAPEDGTAESAACARFYEQARDTLLEMHNWNFATKRVALTEVTAGSDTDSWDYSYVLPADFMRAISIIPTGAVNDYSFTPEVDTTSVSNFAAYQPKEFAIEMNEDGDMVLYTDEEDAVLRYVAYVTDPNFFSPLFTAALGWHLAGMLAGQLIKGDVGAAEGKRCNQMMMAYMAKASESDSNQRKIQVQVNVPWMSR